MVDAFVDGRGVPFARYRELLPNLARNFPPANRVRDRDFGRRMYYDWQWCQVCGALGRRGAILEIHHMFAGRHGKSDELCAVIMCCRECHERYGPQSEANVGLLLFRKWATDAVHTDWVRSAILRRRFLPDLAVDWEGHRRYMRRIGEPAWKTCGKMVQ